MYNIKAVEELTWEEYWQWLEDQYVKAVKGK